MRTRCRDWRSSLTSVAGSYCLRLAARVVRRGGVIAYPTEAVFGLGCDPLNPGGIQRLLDIKSRRADKGLIVIASAPSQLVKLVDWAHLRELSDRSRPGSGRATTWIVRAVDDASELLSGGRDTIAVRLTSHPRAALLCTFLGGALVSTSANRTGHQAARSAHQVRRFLGTTVDYIVGGQVDRTQRPSRIIDLETGAVLRD